MNSKFADPVYCIMRLVIGLNYACHGGQKLLGFPGGGHGAGGMAFIAGIIELVCNERKFREVPIMRRLKPFPDFEARHKNSAPKNVIVLPEGN